MHDNQPVSPTQVHPRDCQTYIVSLRISVPDSLECPIWWDFTSLLDVNTELVSLVRLPQFNNVPILENKE